MYACGVGVRKSYANDHMGEATLCILRGSWTGQDREKEKGVAVDITTCPCPFAKDLYFFEDRESDTVSQLDNCSNGRESFLSVLSIDQ